MQRRKILRDAEYAKKVKGENERLLFSSENAIKLDLPQTTRSVLKAFFFFQLPKAWIVRKELTKDVGSIGQDVVCVGFGGKSALYIFRQARSLVKYVGLSISSII